MIERTSQIMIDVVAEEIEHIGFSAAARLTGHNRGYLYHAFGGARSRKNNNPGFKTVCDIAEALGFTVQIVRK